MTKLPGHILGTQASALENMSLRYYYHHQSQSHRKTGGATHLLHTAAVISLTKKTLKPDT